ncbi:MAG: type I methionyl aminopeptidase [Candidatus Margulisbacteria bacterium]|nr:type I methionyl aminopeptidase [Candidatus Margulisiibacteriota bacterium]
MSREAIYKPAEIEKIAVAGKLVAQFFELLKGKIKPGLTTLEIDNWATEFAEKNKAIATFREVPNYYHSTCVSINEQIVHGIPGDRILQEGDLVKVDYGLKKDGYIGDSCCSFLLGETKARVKKLVEVTEKSLYKGIESAKLGKRLGDIGYAIQHYVETNGFSVVREYTGHGVGIDLHESPSVPHYGHKGTGLPLKEGMVIAIEPMVNMGTWKSKVLSDGWTVVTLDGKWSAQFEHTIAITADGPRILTKI